MATDLLHRRVLPVRPRSYYIMLYLRHRRARQIAALKAALVELGKSGVLLIVLSIGALFAALVNGGHTH